MATDKGDKITLDAGGRSETLDETLASRWESVIARIGPLAPVLQRIDLSLSARQAALEIGLKDSLSLNRWLRSRHLPPFRSLRDWYYVACLTEVASNGSSLATFALQRNQYPSIYYRFVDRVTGSAWRSIDQRGVAWVRATALQQWTHWTLECDSRK